LDDIVIDDIDQPQCHKSTKTKKSCGKKKRKTL